VPSLKGKAPLALLARACHQDCIKQPLHSMQVDPAILTGCEANGR
jgi:hypothetical protein